MPNRVVVTGIGLITSIGIGREEFWNNCLAGKSGISEITSIDTSTFENHRGGEIREFKSEGDDRCSQLAISATRLALEDAKINPKKIGQAGVCMGTTMGESLIFEKYMNKWLKDGEGRLNSAEINRYPCHLIPSNVAKKFNFSGRNIIIPNACSAGNCAIGYAYDLIHLGLAPSMIAGGSEPFSEIAFYGFNRLGAVSPDFPRPFDKDRKGMMVGEGAGMLLLETLDSALKRKASIYAEILGYGLSDDAHHMTAPHTRGKGMALAMLRALKNANVVREDIDYINVHGTGTMGNDAAETVAIKKVFGRKPRVLVSSTKSMLGHTMGAASAIESSVCVLAIQNNIAPPTMNIREVDPKVTFDVLPNKAKQVEINYAMNNGSAFGGNNASVIFKKYKR
ncbi:beta-ketoacyl-[acyl-carrier-protein] synthase family protein [Candidatus Margulisiibacteriota bacterium]